MMKIALPDDWTHVLFPQGYEFTHKDGRKAFLPLPYKPMPAEWWAKTVLDAIENAKP